MGNNINELGKNPTRKDKLTWGFILYLLFTLVVIVLNVWCVCVCLCWLHLLNFRNKTTDDFSHQTEYLIVTIVKLFICGLFAFNMSERCENASLIDNNADEPLSSNQINLLYPSVMYKILLIYVDVKQCSFMCVFWSTCDQQVDYDAHDIHFTQMQWSVFF